MYLCKHVYNNSYIYIHMYTHFWGNIWWYPTKWLKFCQSKAMQLGRFYTKAELPHAARENKNCRKCFLKELSLSQQYPCYFRITKPNTTWLEMTVLCCGDNKQLRLSGWQSRTFLLETVSELQSSKLQANCSWENGHLYLVAAHCATSAFNQ